MRMLTEIGSTLTRSTGGLVDFLNIGGLVSQRTRQNFLGLWHHYSWRELLVRGGVVMAMVSFAALGAATCPDETCSTLGRAALGATVGFFSAHVVVMAPTLARRCAIRKATEDLYKKINYELKELTEHYSNATPLCQLTCVISSNIQKFCTRAFTLSLPVQKRGDAIQNMITIKTLMRKIDEAVQELKATLNETDESIVLNQLASKEFKGFWERDFSTIKEELTGKRTVQIFPISSVTIK